MTLRKTWTDLIKNRFEEKAMTRRILKTTRMGMTSLRKERGSHPLKVLREFWVKRVGRILMKIATCNIWKEIGKVKNFFKRNTLALEEIHQKEEKALTNDISPFFRVIAWV